MKEPLEKFGAFITHSLRDEMLFYLNKLLAGAWKAPELQELQKSLSQLDDAQKQLLYDVVDHITKTGMHSLLFALQEQADADGSIRVFVDGQEVAKLSDGLHGEISGDEGWIVRYSKYPSEIEVERSRWAETWIRQMFGKKDTDKT